MDGKTCAEPNEIEGGHGIFAGEFRVFSLGATLRGWLYLPDGTEGALPAVLMTHGFTATRTMTIDKYAEAIEEAGFAALV